MRPPPPGYEQRELQKSVQVKPSVIYTSGQIWLLADVDVVPCHSCMNIDAGFGKKFDSKAA